MRLIDKLIARRDAAHKEYVKWVDLVAVLQSDPEFASITHYGTTKVMQQALALHTANGNRTTPPVSDEGRAKRSAAAKAAWTPERRAKYAKRLKKLSKAGKNPGQFRKNGAQRTYTAADLARRSDSMRERLKDPAFQKKRIAALRKAMLAKQKAAAAAVESLS